MADLNLRPVPPNAAASSSKPIPTSSILKPWQFEYAPSPDGRDLNLLIMFHGLGDTKAAFAGLGRQLNLLSTAVLSLQAPDPCVTAAPLLALHHPLMSRLPLLEDPAWSWYNTFTQTFEPLPYPNPSSAIPALRRLLSTLTAPEIGWDPTQIHLFGWGQGGTMALELALDIGKSPLDTGAGGRKRLGSVVSVCGGLIFFPTSELGIETPIAYFTRTDPRGQVGQKELASVKRGFKKVQVVQAQGGGQNMPRGKDEWQGIMRFWSEVLIREESWKAGGDVYEVVR